MLKVTLHESRPLSWWYEQFRHDKLDMKPRYQRRSDLWNPWKKSHLIDSILNGFDVPKFYVADFTKSRSGLNRAHKPYAIIDGKQRFEAIFEFLAGDLPLNLSFSLYQDPEMEIGGVRYGDLKAKYPTLAARVDEFVPVVMSVVTDEEPMIQQMFIRLNSGEPANSAERRNAMPGPVPSMIRELVTHPFFQTRIRFGVKRMQEFNLAAKLLLIEFREKFVDTKARNLDQFVTEGASARSIAPFRAAHSRVIDVLEAMSPLFRPRDPLLAAQGHIPVYYWYVRENPTRRRHFREFLEQFTEQVRENLELSREDPDAADAELSTYYTSGRTTNDQASLETRYRILVRRSRRR
jgi:hypothetical protein